MQGFSVSSALVSSDQKPQHIPKVHYQQNFINETKVLLAIPRQPPPAKASEKCQE
ncbi:hypothetical protein FRC07_009845, partial [Ceratobasidium sp. 392]